MREKLITVIGVIILTGFSFAAFTNIRNTNNKIKFKEIEVKSQEVKLKQLNQEYEKVLDTKTKTEEEKKQQSDKIHQLEQEKLKLEEQLSAKLKKQEEARLAKARLDKEAKQVAGVGRANASGCNTGNPHKDYIYMKESGCNPRAVNPIGCKGIGQSCPASKIAHCGDDFACQDAWFSNYAVQKYGSWEKAYIFWLANHWW